MKRYFTAVLELSKSDNQFPINLDEVWMLVYAQKDKAVRALKKNFYEGEDYHLTQNGEVIQSDEIQNGIEVSYYLSLSCMEYFIARKVRPVFEVYRQVFHKTAVAALPTTYKEALTQLLSQVEQNEKLQEENARLQERKDTYFKGLVVAESLIKDQKKIIKEQKEQNEQLAEDNQTKQNIINLQSGELDTLIPKGKIYDQVIQSPNDTTLSCTSSVANEIGMSGQRLNKMLVASGIIYEPKKGQYLFTSEYLKWNLGKNVSVMIDQERGRVKTYIKWNTRGRAYIHALHEVNWDKRRAWHLLKRGNGLQTINA